MAQPDDPTNPYVDLLKRAVTNYLYLGGDTPFERFRCVTHYDVPNARWKIGPLARPASLLSSAQLDLIAHCVRQVERDGVPGDLLEAGIWRGGAVIFLRGLLEAYGIAGRTVIAADSFAGIPLNTRARGDPVDQWRDRWVAGLDEVKATIARFGLLDSKIRFVPGFFADSLPALDGERFALIRLDSDSYDSVETSLDHLYPLLSRGGIVIIDDWHLVGCRKAVEDYRARHAIDDPVALADGNAYWVKGQEHGEPASAEQPRTTSARA